MGAFEMGLLKPHTVTMLMLPLMTFLLSILLPTWQFPGQLRGDTAEVNKSFEEYLKLCNTLGIQPISTGGGYTAGRYPTTGGYTGGRYPTTGGYTSYAGYPSYTSGYVYPSNTGSYVYPSNTGGYAYPTNNGGYIYYQG